jgi:hypothetical protein
MASPTAIRNKIDSTLRRVGPRSRKVYKRALVITGNTLVGRQVVTPTDVLMNPQPMYREVKQALALSGGQQVSVGDYSFVMSANSVTLEELESNNLQFVLKDAAGNAEVLKLIGFGTPEYQGVALMFSVYAGRLAS